MINPAAGNGRARGRWRRVERLLRDARVSITAVETQAPGDGARLAREAIADGARVVIAVGGDGTVHEVVNGFYTAGGLRKDVVLGIVPAGTGMDFVRNADLPRRPDSLVSALLEGRERRLDVGLAESTAAKLFVNFAETGLGATVVAREARMSDAWPGRLSFFMAAARASLEEESIDVAVSVDGDVVYEGPAISVVVANGQYFGGGMKIAPLASMEDGRLDVLVLGDLNRVELMSQIWRLYPGSHISHPKVSWHTGTRVTVTPATPTRLDLDGELDGPGPYAFRVLAGALRVCG